MLTTAFDVDAKCVLVEADLFPNLLGAFLPAKSK